LERPGRAVVPAPFLVVDRRPWWHARYQQGRWDPAGRLLLPLSWLYGLLAFGRHRLLKGRARAPRPPGAPYVVSVGNLEMGGTGKTPVCLALAAALHEAGERVAVVTRGYRSGEGSGVRCYDRAGKQEGDPGDEGRLYRLRLPEVPLVVAPRRGRGVAASAERYGARVVLLDDAFQHLGVRRDLDLVLVPRESRPGSGRLLPAGPLREGRWALSRADVIVISGEGETGGRRAAGGPSRGVSSAPGHAGGRVLSGVLRPSGLFDPSTGREGDPGSLAGVRVIALSGIARAEGFEAELVRLGAELRGAARYPDHHRFSERELEEAEGLRRRAGGELVILTEKDGVRLGEGPLPATFRVLTARFHLEGMEDLVDRIRAEAGADGPVGT
jgi:tetraacyldisaccharide 4'-kinase